MARRPITPNASDPAASAEPNSAGLPDTAASGRAPWRGNALTVAALWAAAAAVILALPGALDRFQQRQPRYGAERALRWLAQGRLDAALAEVRALEDVDRPFRVEGWFGRRSDETWEGRVLRERVLIYERLAAELFGAGQRDAAERMLWKSLLEYHMASRVVEFVAPWELMLALQACAAPERGDAGWRALMGTARVLAAMGVTQPRPPDAIRPMTYPVDPDDYRDGWQRIPELLIDDLGRAMQAQTQIEARNALLRLRRSAIQTREPALRRMVLEAAQRAMARAGDPATAAMLMDEAFGVPAMEIEAFWRPAGADSGSAPGSRALRPDALDWLWRARPDPALPIEAFLERAAAAAGGGVLDCQALTTEASGYFSPLNRVRIEPDGSARLDDSVAAALEFETDKPLGKLYLALQAEGVLGFYPILLVRVDGGPWIPMYADHPRPDLEPMEATLPPGRHRLDVYYLNDAAFDTRAALIASMREKAIVEQRSVRLIRVAWTPPAP